MKIEAIHIKNLRAIDHAVVELDNYGCLIGANGAGKSTVLTALNIFFREGSSFAGTTLRAEDFHRRRTSMPIEVTVWFHDLSADAQVDFKDYFRQNRLIVSAVATFDSASGQAEIKQFGQRLAMTQFAEYFQRKGDGAKVEELRQIYASLQADLPDLPKAATGGAMEEALKAYEAARPEMCELIPSEDQFYGVSKGQNRLEKYVQWVYVPAVKDASTEQSEGKSTALGKLLARTVRAKVNFSDRLDELTKQTRERYQLLLDDSQGALDGVSKALGDRLRHWAHPAATLKVAWHQDPEKTVRVDDPFAKVVAGEGEFEGELSRFGHGFQRSFLLALLQELATTGASGGPRLILGCEEPELYQHPPQARHLAAVLLELANSGSQVIVSTHSPLFVAGETFEYVRLVRRNEKTKSSTVQRPNVAEVGDAYQRALGERPQARSASSAKIGQILQPALAEMFFTQRLVLVEGLEDVAYITSWLALTDRLTAYRGAGCHLVPVGGKSELLRPAILARHMEIPLYVAFDADANKIEHAEHRRQHERDNRALLTFLNGDTGTLFPTEIKWGADYCVFPTDLGDQVDVDLSASLGVEAFRQVRDQAHSRFGNSGGLKKNHMFVAEKLAIALDSGGRVPCLDKLCDALIGLEERFQPKVQAMPSGQQWAGL